MAEVVNYFTYLEYIDRVCRRGLWATQSETQAATDIHNRTSPVKLRCAIYIPSYASAVFLAFVHAANFINKTLL